MTEKLISSTSRLEKRTGINVISFTPYIAFYKDGIQFAKVDLELLRDLTFISHDRDSPFKGPEFTAKEAGNELYCMLKNELNDPELDDELSEVLFRKDYESKD